MSAKMKFEGPAYENRLAQYWRNVKAKDFKELRRYCQCEQTSSGRGWGRGRYRRHYDPSCPDCMGTGRAKTYEPFCSACVDTYGIVHGNNGRELCECQRHMQRDAWSREKARKNAKHVDVEHVKSVDALMFLLHVKGGGHYVKPKLKLPVRPARKVEP